MVLLLAAFGAVSAQAGTPKVDVCHLPANGGNFHTIRISEKALPAHLAHGDLSGACNESCAQLCDDGNACTIDDTGDCETQGCPSEPLAVDCSDDSLCTDDFCDSVNGCVNLPSVICSAPDLCTNSTCDPLTGQCLDTPIVCSEGEVCNPETGECEGGVLGCPCFTAEDLDTIAVGGSFGYCENYGEWSTGYRGTRWYWASDPNADGSFLSSTVSASHFEEFPDNPGCYFYTCTDTSTSFGWPCNVAYVERITSGYSQAEHDICVQLLDDKFESLNCEVGVYP